MPYYVRSSLHDDDVLDYTFEGGNAGLTVDGLLTREGRPVKEANLFSCFLLSVRVPSQLMPAVPTRIVVKARSDGFIPDLAWTGAAISLGSCLVSDRVAELVDRLEPALHQFIPIANCIDTRGNSIAKSFLLMNVLTRLNAIDIEHSDVQWRTIRPLLGPEVQILVPKPKINLELTLRRDAIAGHHLWRGDAQGMMGAYFISDDLHDLLQETGISLAPLRLTYCEVL